MMLVYIANHLQRSVGVQIREVCADEESGPLEQMIHTIILDEYGLVSKNHLSKMEFILCRECSKTLNRYTV